MKSNFVRVWQSLTESSPYDDDEDGDEDNNSEDKDDEDSDDDDKLEIGKT